MLPNIRGTMDRRLLVNYRADTEAFEPLLPQPFRPREVGDTGKGIGSLCLMRIENARPWFAPFREGMDVETLTHRISVEWERNGATGCGVYVPRRDVSSRLYAVLGDRFAPGEMSSADFDIEESEDGDYRAKVDCGTEFANVAGSLTDEVDDGSVFDSLEDASSFFSSACVRYSESESGERHDGIEMRAREWSMEPLETKTARSSFFKRVEGVEFDSAFCMRGIDHEWRGSRPLAKPEP